MVKGGGGESVKRRQGYEAPLPGGAGGGFERHKTQGKRERDAKRLIGFKTQDFRYVT